MPLHMRLPKLKGFKNPFRTEYQVVNVSQLAELFPSGGTVDVAALVAAGAVRRGHLVKVLGDGDVSVALNVTADKFLRVRRGQDRRCGRFHHRLVLTCRPGRPQHQCCGRPGRSVSVRSRCVRLPRRRGRPPSRVAGPSRTARSSGPAVPKPDAPVAPEECRRSSCSLPSSLRSARASCATRSSSPSPSSRSSGWARWCRPRVSTTARCSDASPGPTRAASSGSSTCSAAGRCCSSPSSRSGSCRTSRPASSCSCSSS